VIASSPGLQNQGLGPHQSFGSAGGLAKFARPSLMLIKPSLKRGVSYSYAPQRGELSVGTQYRWIHFPDQWDGINPRRLIELFDGVRSVAELARLSGTKQSQVISLIQELQRHDLIDLHRPPISYLERYNPEIGRIEKIFDTENFATDYAIQNFLSRMEIECDAQTLAPGDLDAGRSAVLNRREFSILIFGRGKIVNALVGILSASGFTKLNVINRLAPRHPGLKITETDISGGFVSRKHIGESRRNVIDEIRVSSSLYPNPKSPITTPDLVISVGRPAPDALQRWVSENTRHLLVDLASSGEVRVGPLVIPGKTPCFRCVELAEQKPIGVVQGNKSIEVCAILSFAVASSIAADAAVQASQSKSVFLATSITYSMRNFQQPEINSWVQHPECGCAWS
jgi:hypothetical protein